MTASSQPAFEALGLGPTTLRALADLGYEVPSPIQLAAIPALLARRDVLGQAQTGTGKTAAFALPILERLVPSATAPQALVLVPTRELALQVAEAFQRYAVHRPGFHVLPVYGGQGYGPQLAALRRGVHVVVGTPGRVIDHIGRGTLDLSRLSTLVLDEADEMLRMGFAEDVEKILQATPAARQTALFSATLPAAIRRLAQTYLRDPQTITVAARTGTATGIRQRWWLVGAQHKLDALTRLLEAEPFDAMIVFVRTKVAADELATRLEARGFAAAALHGDVPQPQRERIVEQLRAGAIDLLVATDVAARGLDVERISHVINFDMPSDPESYTHRIGRTGRAGRSGDAILFVTPRERGLLAALERATRQRVERLQMPTAQAINATRIARFKARITEALAGDDLDVYERIVTEYERETDVPPQRIAAALARLSQRGVPLLLATPDERPAAPGLQSGEGTAPPVAAPVVFSPPVAGARRSYRVEVGSARGVRPGNLVGAIANEIGLDARQIGRIDVFDDHSRIDLPADLPTASLEHLRTVRVGGVALAISEASDAPADPGPARRRPAGARPASPRRRTAS